MPFFIIDSKERRAACVEYIRHLKGTPIQCVFVKEYKRNRSESQNRLYHMWLNLIAKETGAEPEHLHEEMKVRVLGWEVRTILGEEVRLPKSTTKLTVQDFTQLLHAVDVLARSLDIVLPHPDDMQYAMYGTTKETKHEHNER
jgi:redox-sensitive bicupin YhaK (pirin superfamily)